MSRKWTLDEFAMHFWGTYPQYEFIANLEWLRSIVANLNVGGLWAWPEKKIVLRKVDNDTIEEVKMGE